MGQEPAHVELLGEPRSEDIEGLGREAGDRKVADEQARVVHHRGQDHPADRRHPVRKQVAEPSLRGGTGHLVFGEVRDFNEADAVANA